MAKIEPTQSVNRRSFLVGTSAVTLVAATTASSFSMPAAAGITADQRTGPTGLIEIAGRVTNAQGVPHMQAYIEIMHQGIRGTTQDLSADAAHVVGSGDFERFGVWTDDDGVFGLHTWWSNDNGTTQVATTAGSQADVLFDIETKDGNRSQWNVRLDANPHYIDRNPKVTSSLPPVAWSDRASHAQFVANFTVA